jgi:hypothetical protein
MCWLLVVAALHIRVVHLSILVAALAECWNPILYIFLLVHTR